MDFLIDNNISPSIAYKLLNAGHKATHVKNINMSAATDEEIFQLAADSNLTIISADTDFGFILSSWKENLPSVLLLRYLSSAPDIQIKYILNVIDNYSKEISEGSLIVIEPERIRIRKLPFAS